MVKKNNKVPSKAGAYKFPELPAKSVIPDAGILKSVRERVGLSQAALAQECGVSRDVIANYELERTKIDPRLSVSIDDGLKLWRVLEVKERALNAPRKEGEPGAADAVLGLLFVAHVDGLRRLAEIDGQIGNLQRKQESIRRQIEEINSEMKERTATFHHGDRLAEIEKRERDIKSDPTLNAEEKRRRLADLQKLKNRSLARWTPEELQNLLGGRPVKPKIH